MIQTTLSFDGVARVPKGRVKKKDAQPAPARSVIEFFDQYAQYPLFRGSPTKARRVLEIGKGYYWKSHRIPFSTAPRELVEWMRRVGLGSFNSLLVNVYDEPQSYIGWHMDRTENMERGTVVSYSFALRAEDEGKVLAEMEFDERFPTVNLRDKTRVEFDARVHKELGVKHRVRRTFHPRVNLTFRQLS
jgi:hypothetical protein